MDTSLIIEMAGYLGSVLVVISMLMSSVVKLRIINTTGSAISAVYALIIHSYPLALMNICLVIINIYNLAKLLKPGQNYTLVDVKADDTFVEYFLNHYKNDITNFFPEKSTNTNLNGTAYLICHDAVPAGLMLGNITENGVLEISVDYASPKYRDCSLGTFLYSKLPEKGIHKLVYSQEPGQHRQYLEKMGFNIENGAYVKYLL